MLHTLRSLSLGTRTLLMVLLVLGALLRSGMTLATELHAAEHQIHSVQLDRGHDPGHQHGHAHDEHGMPVAAESGHDQGEGLHGLLHQCSGLHFAVLFVMCSLASAPAISPLSFFTPDIFLSAPRASPFRPPIA